MNYDELVFPSNVWCCGVAEWWLMMMNEERSSCDNLYLLTYSAKQSPSWEVNRFSASQEISWRFITTFPIACNLSLSWTSPVHSPPPNATSWRSMLILSFHLSLVLWSCSPPQVPPPKPCIHLSDPAYMLHASPISFFLILSPEKYWVRSTTHWASHYLVFSTALLPQPS